MLVNFGLLVLRVSVGLIVAAHGAQKLFGWFGGGGLQGSRKMMESLHLRPPMFWAVVSAVNEFAGGLLTALGLLMPLGPVLIIANMLTAIAYVHWSKGFWNSKGGLEYPLSLGLASLALGIIGAGAYSLDALVGFQVPEPQALVVGLIAVLIGFGIATLLRHRFVPASKHVTA